MLQSTDLKDGFETKVENWLNDQLTTNKSLIIPNLDQVKSTLVEFFKGGIDKFSVISDFDATLTKYWVSSGVKFVAGHNIPGETNIVSNKFVPSLKELSKDYHSYETSLEHTIEEKSAKLDEWYGKINDIFIGEKISKESLARMAEQVTTTYREGAKDLIHNTNRLGVPLLICSAGIEDIIEALIQHDNLYTTNISIASNKMIFSPDPPNGVIDFEKPYIHVFNKGDYDVTRLHNYKEFLKRPNQLILGDSLGDLTMGSRFTESRKLKIGFVNYDEDHFLPHYLKAFDIVLTGDTSMDFINNLMKLLSS